MIPILFGDFSLRKLGIIREKYIRYDDISSLMHHIDTISEIREVESLRKI